MPAHQSFDQQEFLYRIMGGTDATAQAAAYAAAANTPYGEIVDAQTDATALAARVASLELDRAVSTSGTGAAPATGAQTLNLATHRIFHRVKGDNGQTWTFTNPVAGAHFWLVIEQDDTGTRLKPTLAGYTFSTKGGSGALSTLSTTPGLIDVFEFVAVTSAIAVEVSQTIGADE